MARKQEDGRRRCTYESGYSDTPNLYINSPSKIYTNYVNDSDCGASIYVTDAETDYDGTIFYFYLDNEAIGTNPYNENIDL